MAVQQVDSADGTTIAFRALGSGPPIVFVHGTATSAVDWLFVSRLLRDRFTAVTMDRRGRGESGDAFDYAIEREAEDVLAVLEAVDGELLVGHSYGAMCSILAAERTDRLRRLVLYEPPIAVRADTGDRVEALLGEGGPEAAIEGFLRGAGAPEAELDRIRASASWPVLLATAPTVPRELRAAEAWRHPGGPIDIPTLFLVGAETDNRAYLDGLDELLAAFTDLRRDSIVGPQHVAHVFNAERFAELVSGFCAEP
jgi:pimeloyl-ACP methyl ester carboxylesterase